MFGLRHVLNLHPVEVVVVHPHGRIDVHPKFVASLDRRSLWIFPPFDHAQDVFCERIGMGVGVASAGAFANSLDDLAVVPSVVLAHGPEMRPYPGVFHGSVHGIQELLHRLGRFMVAVGRSVPVVDDSVVRRSRHSSLLCQSSRRVW